MDANGVGAVTNSSSENEITLLQEDKNEVHNISKDPNLMDPFRKLNRKRNGKRKAQGDRLRKGKAKRKRIDTNSSTQTSTGFSNATVPQGDGTTVPKRSMLRRRKNRKRRRKQKKTTNALLEVTTSKGIIFSTRTESNDTINKLIEKLNENPEDNFDEFKNKKRTEKLVVNSKSTFFDPLANITELISSNNVSDLDVVTKQNIEKKFSRCRRKRGGCAHICNPKGKVKCSCLEGFYLGADQRSCYDVDECKVNNGDCETECLNLIGSYSCKCPTGFTLADDRKSCQDINECLLRNGHGPCQDTCENTVGSYKCSCEALKGTKLSDDGHLCEDLNECNVSNGGCSHNCINTLGRSFCSCPDGMELSSDWKTCQDVNECEDEALSVKCKNCVNTPGSYVCLDMSEMQNDQSQANVVCKPIFPPSRGFVSCTRKGAFQSFTKKGRKRTINSPGTVCELKCPTGFRLTGKYHVICGTNGDWDGNQTGKCIEALPPILKCPPSQNLILDDGSDAIHVKFPSPITDVNWKYVTAFPNWAKDLEGRLTQGSHDISFTVRDPNTRLFSSCHFKIIVDSNRLQ